MLDLNISSKEGNQFKENYKKIKYPLIPSPTKKEPFQIIHEHTLEDAHYLFKYIDEKSPLNIEYQTYDGKKFLVNIEQKGEDCEYECQGDGGTQDQFVTFRFLNQEGKIHSVRSSEISSLPLELTEDSTEGDIQDIKNVAKNFFNEIKKSSSKKTSTMNKTKTSSKKAEKIKKVSKKKKSSESHLSLIEEIMNEMKKN